MKTKILSLLTLVLLASCASDDGNYEYTTLNELTITGIEESYEIEQFTQLEITPTITGTLSYNEADYEYLWYLFIVNDRSGADADTLSREKNLNVMISKSPSDDYSIVFQVKEKSSGRITMSQIDLQVVNTYSKGLAILSDIGGMADISFINSLDNVTQNAYEAVNGMPAGRGPIGIFHAGRKGNCGQMMAISTEDSCFMTSSTDFSYMMNFQDMFYFPSSPGRLENILHGQYGYDEYCVVDGKVYKRSIYLWDENSDPYPKYSTYLAADGTVSPIGFFNDNITGFFYDIDNRQFIYDNYYGLVPMSEGYGNQYFDPLDMGMDLVWGDVLLTDDEESYLRAVMRDDSGAVYVVSGLKGSDFDMETYDSWYFINPRGKLLLTGETASATCYAMSTVDVNFLYCAFGNKITCVSILTGNTISETTLDGGNIDRMEIDPNNPSRMYVGVSDGSATANSGSVYYLAVGANGQLTVDRQFNAICGKVVDFEVNFAEE